MFVNKIENNEQYFVEYNSFCAIYTPVSEKKSTSSSDTAIERKPNAKRKTCNEDINKYIPKFSNK